MFGPFLGSGWKATPALENLGSRLIITFQAIFGKLLSGI